MTTQSLAETAADRRRFGRWALLALIVTLPAWWFLGADLATAALRPVVQTVLQLFGLDGPVRRLDSGDWLVTTGMVLQNGESHALGVSRGLLRQFSLGVPLLAAFMIAPPRATDLGRSALIGAGVMAVLFVLSVTTFVWGELAAMLDPSLATARSRLTVPLAADPLHPLAAQVAIIGRYIASSIAPLMVSVVLWAILNPAGREVLLGKMVEAD